MKRRHINMSDPYKFEEVNENDGEYRFTPPSRSAYSDAGYIPAADAGAVPRSYHVAAPDTEKKKSRKGGRIAGMIAACLACAILGGTLGGWAVPKLAGRQVDAATAVETPVPRITPALATSGGAADVSATAAAAGKEMTPTEIYYNLAVNQTVAITTEITYTTIWGYTTSGAVKGSGFILTEDGYIMTNQHVIEDAVRGGYDIEVLMYDGTEYIARVVGYAEENDVAVIKIDATGLSPVTLGDSDSMKVGEPVYTVGNPTGELEFSMTDGMISATDRELAVRDGNRYRILNLFQTTAAINGGNSGGPIYNSRGEVIGIATAGGDSSQVEALFFGIPINDAAGIANDLISDGYVRGKAYMGILRPSTLEASKAQYYGIVPGVYFEGIEEGSAAEKAGLKVGDIIVAIGNYEIADTQDLTNALSKFHAGDSSTVRVYRNSAYEELAITFDEVTPDSGTQTNENTSGGGQQQGGFGNFYDYFYDFFNGNPFGR